MMVAPRFGPTPLGVVVLLVSAIGSPAMAHQGVSLSVPVGELGEAPAPLKGSTRFFAEALPLLRPRCDAGQSEKLDEVLRLLGEAERVRWGALPAVDARVADHLRGEAERKLLALLASFEGTVAIDLASPEVRLDDLDLDPQHNSVLVRVAAGDGPAELALVDWDLTGEAFDRTTVLDVAPRGTTHALVRLRNVPQGESTFRFAVRRRGDREPSLWRALRVRTPPFGRLRVSLRDDAGRPTHALLAVRSAGGGNYWEQPDAVDLRAQLNAIVGPPVSEPGRGYTFFLPGKKRGRYWIAPPETDLTLPAGDWRVVALRGPEHTPDERVVKIDAGELTEVACQPRRWTDLPSGGWWSGDDHVHARLMSDADAERLLDYAEAVDLHVANILEMGDPLRTYYAQRGFGRDYRSRRGNRWLVPGQEDPRSDLGHAIGLNLRRKVRDLDIYLRNDLLAEQVHAGGGLYGHTHVGANACFVHREMALFTPRGIVDFNSIMQATLGVDLYYDFLNLGFKMTASAGADTPYGGTVGAVRVYAHTGDKARLDLDAWFDALRRGETFVTNGPMLDFTVNGAPPGSTIETEPSAVVKVIARATGDPGWSAPRRLSLVRLGEVARSVESEDPNEGVLTIEASIDPGEGCWIAAHAVGHDGSEAHTTPVYVTVDGAWHGATSEVPRLVAKQQRVLDEIESMLVDAEARVAAGSNPLDLASRNTARQAEAVREQIALARRAYVSLAKRISPSGE